MHTKLPSIALLLALAFGCEGGCGESGGLEGGTVGNARDERAPMRTSDGLEVISGQRSNRSAQSESDPNLIREPNRPDPHGGEFTLTEAVEGMETDGQLVAEFNTTFGTLFCDLYADKVPNTVANFIGLARGKRAWWDARSGEWRRAPAYDGTHFFRVIPDYMIQAGDYLNDGTGTVGYTIDDEPHASLAHDEPGLLCMASTGEDQNGAQFFITDGPTPQLDTDDQFTIFGRCRPEDMIRRMARVPQGEDNRPTTDIVIQRVRIRRVQGGAANARVTPPRLPDGVDPERVGRESSPGPSELYIPERERDQNVFDPRQWNGRSEREERGE